MLNSFLGPKVIFKNSLKFFLYFYMTSGMHMNKIFYKGFHQR